MDIAMKNNGMTNGEEYNAAHSHPCMFAHNTVEIGQLGEDAGSGNTQYRACVN